MQKRRHSLLEVCLSTAIGFGVAFTANIFFLPLFGWVPTVSENLALTGLFTIVSLIRGYYVRRLFNWLHAKELL